MAFDGNAFGKAAKWIWNIMASGLPIDGDLDTLRKHFLLNPIIILGIVFLTLFGILAFIQYDHLLGAADLSVALFLMYLLYYLRKSRNVNLAGTVGTLVAGVFYLFLIANGGVNRSAYMWAFTYPLITLFLLGKRLGTYLSLS